MTSVVHFSPKSFWRKLLNSVAQFSILHVLFFSPFVTQASGVAISDDVITHYDLIRVRLQGTDEKARLKLVVMRLSDDLKTIIVDEKKCLKVKDVEHEKDVFKKIISMLPSEECRYALYDCKYTNKESVKEDLVFIFS